MYLYRKVSAYLERWKADKYLEKTKLTNPRTDFKQKTCLKSVFVLL